MAFSHSPRKAMPLATGDEKPPSFKSKSGPSLTRRVFYCGVVVESPEYGRGLHPDVQDLVASLGDPLDLGPDASSLSSTSDPGTDESQSGAGPYQRKRAMTDATALADVINELVTTERSYVKRLRTLKADYADPLRMFSRSKDTAIIPPYEAKTLFGNVDNLLPINEVFLEDLEKMVSPDGQDTVGGVGDVALKHFRDSRGFENYKQYYSKREEAQAIFEKEMKKASGFAAFIDRIKYSSTDAKNRVGLRELLMDPVQRIPRYTLLFRTMIKLMGPNEPQRAKLIEADEIASKIALAETDDQTKRATIMYCLGAAIEDFPPALISNSRRFIDCIDVEDVLSESYSAPGSSTSSNGPPPNLHCSLVLFDDKLMIVKRPGNGEKGCRVLAGLVDTGKPTKSGKALSLKKSGMVCKGVVDVTDVVITDVGGPDFHLYLEAPPTEQTERWAGRPFRSLSVVVPPSPINLDPSKTELEKKRFLDNVWVAQARYRTRAGQSVVLRAEEREVENRTGKVTRATTYFNVYQRTAFLKEPKKTKIVLHIDETGAADPLPFGIRSSPFVVVRVHPMPAELSRYTVTSNDPNDEGENDIVQTVRIPDRIIQTIHQFGLFKFRTGNVSVPSTPTASSRSRAAIFGLDAISRNLFGALPGSGKGDIFGGSVNNHRRSKTAVSRSSVYTQSTSTGDGSLSPFSRSNSTTTAATTMSLMDDDRSMSASISSGSRNSKTRSRSLSKTKKLVKRGKSPVGSGSDRDSSPSGARTSSRLSQPALASGRSRSPSVERGEGHSDYEEEGLWLRDSRHMDESERDLVARLELARRNSQNQSEMAYPAAMEKPIEETIYEEEPPIGVRPTSRASRMSRGLPEIPQDAQSQRSTTPQPRSTTPGDLSESDSPRESRSTSRHVSDRRPIGPRSPSPLPPSTPIISTMPSVLSEELDISFERTLINMSHQPTTPHHDRLVSPIPRSKRQPFEPTGNTDLTPRAFGFDHDEIANPPGVVEPLSIKKKSSVRENGSPTQGRRTYALNRNSPLMKARDNPNSSKRVSSLTKTSRIPVPTHLVNDARVVQEMNLDKLISLSESTKEDVESARRAIKRIKLDTEQLRFAAPASPAHDMERPASPMKGLRSISRNATPITKEAQARMDEMRQLIGRRQGELPFRTRQLNMSPDVPRARTPESPARVSSIAKSIEEFASLAGQQLEKAEKTQDLVHTELKSLGAHLKEKSKELERTRVELQSAQRQTEVVKELLADCTVEKDILYEAFNEELDGMYNDANLPEEEAWVAMTSDLRETKKQRAKFENENINLKRRLASLEMQNEEWGALLRAHGLIS